MKRTILISLISSAFIHWQAHSETVQGHRPLAPHTLITQLPDPPEGWKLNRSTAETRFGEWLETYAVRIFEKSTEPTDGEPLQRVTISFLDTATFPGSTSMFDDFQTGDAENYEKRMVKNCPAFLIPLSEEEHETILLVNERFLVTVFSENQTERMRKKWIDILDLAALNDTPEGDLIELPEVIQITKIDQLNPKRNRTYSLAISTDDEPGEDAESDE